MTLRLPAEVAQGVERLASRFGHKPAHLGARLVEEGLRRRDYPLVDLRETSAGRVAYVAGTRFTVYWVAQAVQGGKTAAEFAREYQLPLERVRSALAYAEAFPEEIAADRAHAEANRRWLEQQEASCRSEPRTNGGSRRKGKRKAAR